VTPNDVGTGKQPRHVLALSGGKDSSALAVYIKSTRPHVWERLELVFADTLKELPETYEYLERLESVLERTITRIGVPGGFDAVLARKGGFLPSPSRRWCTELLKIKPFERYIGEDECYMYIGIRADEESRGYKAPKGKRITPVYPFVEDGIDKTGVMGILEEAGLGLPAYYEWRLRSGCYFCFYQRKIEWANLKERHPDLFELAKSYEKTLQDGRRYTWSDRESLEELEKPARIKQIKLFDCIRAEREAQKRICLDGLSDDPGDTCGWCHK